MLEDFQNLTAFNTDPIAILQNLGIALLCGLIIALVYRITYKGASYSAQFVNSLILLSLITAVVIMVIGNNLATAFGLVGAMSIIRFRTAVRDVQDIIFIFFSLAIGLAAGVGLGLLAIIGTVFISLVVFLVIATDINAPRKRMFMLQVSFKGTDTRTQIDEVLSKHCREYQMVGYQGDDVQEIIQSYFHIRLKKKDHDMQLTEALKGLADVHSVNLYFDDIEPRL